MRPAASTPDSGRKWRKNRYEDGAHPDQQRAEEKAHVGTEGGEVRAQAPNSRAGREFRRFVCLALLCLCGMG